MMERWKAEARKLKTEIQALALASRDPRTPWHARALVVLVVAYALSPIDLIPDFIPVLGLLDDLILLPLGVALALRLIPPEVMQDSRERVRSDLTGPANRRAATVIVLVWVSIVGAAAWLVWRR